MVRCQDGVVLRHVNNCRKAHTCPAGHFLLGHARVDHTAMDHGVWIQKECPSGFEGRWSSQQELRSLVFFPVGKPRSSECLDAEFAFMMKAVRN